MNGQPLPPPLSFCRWLAQHWNQGQHRVGDSGEMPSFFAQGCQLCKRRVLSPEEQVSLKGLMRGGTVSQEIEWHPFLVTFEGPWQ